MTLVTILVTYGPVKTYATGEAKAKLSEVLSLAQEAPVLIMRHGRPFAVVSGVEGKSLESILSGLFRATDPMKRRKPKKR